MSKKPFRIGLCMAGAVSAGAYTAGVMDYLLEALAEWDKRRGEPGVPNHSVTIPIMGGASAGGMTALLAASTLNNTITPVPLPEPAKLLDEHPENKLYHSWVDLIDGDMFPHMLETSDIKPGKIISALNSDFIDKIANKMMRSDVTKWVPTPSYFEAPVKIFSTLTNLEGFYYYADLNSAQRNEVRKEKYYMSVHNDYACFEVMDGVKPETGGPWIPLDFRSGKYVATAKDAAMATGAFPAGLKPRILVREKKYVEQIPWLDYVFKNTPLTDDLVTTLNVDGGVINNEPFEKVRDLLNDIYLKEYGAGFISEDAKEKALADINCDYNTFENTVLMIDPFPSVQADPFVMDSDIMTVLPNTLSAMLSQMRAKPKEYKDAMVLNDGSRFIISPSRIIKNLKGEDEEVFGEKAIACGNLSGFGGFLNKEFRIHDYYLGRYNCEIFLRDYFTVPESALYNNEIFKEGYKNADWAKFASGVTKPEEQKEYQIIPIFTPRPAPRTLKMPVFSSGENWPRIKPEDIDRFKTPLKKRVEKLILNVADLPWYQDLLLMGGAKLWLNKKLTNKTLSLIKDSLYEWSLITGYTSDKAVAKAKAANNKIP
ncbi:hypothetical protein Q765_12755 [Flavobacterium rivuli WB 3.3-2 = DSM 21788]|uniref:PNPLA domain-containing protein n=1 Tax=Flavobacterium rivuli WB 3.3-2 = DSM 21788 TaxID=1121895 RepID=A0A0A2M0P2_9FLAO|nr:patatin-like phospholipase family protein [Flavobacterium rivuli]KGO86177.1 hypothetical protein Q765_12755 [Flavobacterium rivuli WB 3.3-2 = DSM 21788]